MKRNFLGLLAVGLLTGSVTAQAAVVINVTEVGGNVVFASSGTLDLAGASLSVPNSYTKLNRGIISGGSNWYYAQGSQGSVSVYRLTGAAGPFGTNASDAYLYDVASSSGTDFGIWGPQYQSDSIPVLFIGSTFVSGSSVTGGLVFAGKSFASMGLTPGEYVYTIPNDTITLRIGSLTGPAPVPLPAAAWLLLSGIAGLGVLRRRKAN